MSRLGGLAFGYARDVASYTRRMSPGRTGFHSLEGVAAYLRKESALRLKVLAGRRAATNNGPTAVATITLSWKNGRDYGAMRKRLEREVEDHVRKVLAGEWPEQGVHLDKCNPSGQNVEEFMDEVCAICTCPYCDLTD